MHKPLPCLIARLFFSFEVIKSCMTHLSGAQQLKLLLLFSGRTVLFDLKIGLQELISHFMLARSNCSNVCCHLSLLNKMVHNYSHQLVSSVLFLSFMIDLQSFCCLLNYTVCLIHLHSPSCHCCITTVISLSLVYRLYYMLWDSIKTI